MTATLISTDTLADCHASALPPMILHVRARVDDHAAGEALWREGQLSGAFHADLEHELAGPPTREGGRHPSPAAGGFTARLRAWGITPQRRVAISTTTSAASW